MTSIIRIRRLASISTTLDGDKPPVRQFGEDAPFFIPRLSCRGFTFPMPNDSVVRWDGSDVESLRSACVPILRRNAIPLTRQRAVRPAAFRCSPASLPRTQSPAQLITRCRFRWTNALRTDCNLPQPTRTASPSTRLPASRGYLNPLPGAHNYAPSLFDARHRFVVSYFWELPVRKFSGFAGKVLNGWAVSGITTYQTGFPIRITSSSDNELMNSFDFELPGEPDQVGAFHWQRPQRNGNYYFNNPTGSGLGFSAEANVLRSHRQRSTNNLLRTGNQRDRFRRSSRTLRSTNAAHFEFRAEIFNLFNHTQFFNPDGNSTDGTQFGQVTEVKDPRLVQFALKFYF